MLKSRTKRRLAAALSVLMVFGNVNMPSAAEPQAGDSAVQVVKIQPPPGSLEECKVYRPADKQELGEVPSYVNGKVRNAKAETVFDLGTGDYGYKSLSEDQKRFYDALKTSLNVLEAGGTGYEEIETQGGSKVYVPFRINFINYNLNDNQAVQTWIAFMADRPWLFWLENGYAINSSEFMPTVRDDYTNVQQNKIISQQIETAVEDYLNAVVNVRDVYEKVRIISDMIIEKVNYAYKPGSSTPQDADWAHTIVGVFDTEHDTVVCEGYAKAFAFILNILDIPNVYVTGDAGGGHAWNCVSFDGGVTYYYMDLTWDDLGEKNTIADNQHLYFAMPKSKFEQKHTPDRPTGTGTDWQYALPVLGDDMDYTYFMRYAAYCEESAVGTLTEAQEFLKGARVLAPDRNKDCIMLVENNNSLLSMLLQTLGLSSISTISASEYGMRLFAAEAASFATVSVPASVMSLSEEKLEIDKRTVSEQTLRISDITADSDDYIRWYSDNNKVVSVKMPSYTKAVQGAGVQFSIKGTGTAKIYAESVRGNSSAQCDVTVIDGSVMPSATPSPSPSATPSPSPSATPSPTPSATPSPSPSATPSPTTQAPTEVKKGQQYIDKATKAKYQVSGTGKNRTVTYLGSTDKKAKKVTVPATVDIEGRTYKVTSIANNAFAGNTRLKEVVIGKNVKTIGKKAFYCCKNLKKIKIGNNVTSIGKSAFEKCSSLKQLVIPKKVKKIGDGAFRRCRSLRYILVKSNKLKSRNVGKNVFSGGYKNPRIKTDKKMWKKYASIFMSRGLSRNALFIINPVKLVI